ncbi:MAG: NAD(P)-binding domain-containing protein [Myxococcota bacterium]
MSPTIGVVGGGGFGRGLALAAHRNGHEVVVQTRNPDRNVGEGVTTTNSFETVAEAPTIFIAVPSQFVEQTAIGLAPHLNGSHYLVHVSRGLVGADLQPITSILRAQTPARRLGALGGPLVAEALQEGTPSGAVIGTRFPEVATAVQEAIASTALRIYTTEDVVGVQAASAMVGLLALAAGFARASKLGPAALAVMATRGIAEAARVGRAIGAQESTFYGLAGFGDISAALAGDERPEVRLGRALSTGLPLEEAAAKAGAFIEGTDLARRVRSYVDRQAMEAPICSILADVLAHKSTAEEAVRALMTRRQKSE